MSPFGERAREDRRLGVLAAVVFLALALAAPRALAAGRLRVRHPVVGGEMEVVVDRVEGGGEVVLLLDGSILDRARADASGCARFRIPVDPGLAGRAVRFSALAAGRTIGPLAVRFDGPELLLVAEVEGPEGVRGRLFRFAVAADGAGAVELRRELDLGPGRPGGAVRDGASTKTLVVADRERGRVLLVPDDAVEAVTEQTLPSDVRSLVADPGGQRWIAVSGRGGVGDGLLTVLDAESERVTAQIALDPLGTGGGRAVALRDGRVFVVVDGLYVRVVDTLRSALGPLVRVGGPGDERVQDLRRVGARLVAVTGRGVDRAGLVSWSPADLGRARRADPAPAEGGVGAAAGALLRLDPRARTLQVLDVDSLTPRVQVAVPAGTVGVLLPAAGSSTRAAFLIEGETGASLSLFDVETGGSLGRRPVAAGLRGGLRVDLVEAGGLETAAAPARWLLAALGRGTGLFAFDPWTGGELRLDAPSGGRFVSVTVVP